MSGPVPQAFEDRLTSLEGRVQVLEDHVAILRLIHSWGPAVDTGESNAAGALWDENGVLESDLSRLEGPAAVRAMVASDGQRALIARGCAHVQTAPIVTVDGDRATVIAYSQVYLHAEDGHAVWRVSANQWDCARSAGTWRITRRINRVIDGGGQSHAVLTRALG
jgi:SnoaL-like domain